MANVLFRRGTQEYINNNVPISDGQVVFNETDQAIYVDTPVNNVITRLRYGGGNLSRSDIDSALSDTSENPVQNKVITESVLQKTDVVNDYNTAVAVTATDIPVGCGVIKTANTKIGDLQTALNTTNGTVAQHTTDIEALNTGLATKIEFIGNISNKYANLSELYTAGQNNGLKMGMFQWNTALRPADADGYVFIGNWSVTAIRDDFNVIFRLNSNSTWEKVVDLATDNDFLKFHGIITDLDLALKNGIWVYNSPSVHYPSGSDYGICLTLNSGNDSYNGVTWFFQLAFETNGSIYTRRSINATDESGWSNWVRVN